MRETHTRDQDTASTALLNTRQAAKFLGLSRRTVENRRVSGIDSPPYIKIGRSVRYDPRDLDAFLAARRFRSTSEADHRAAA